MTNRYAETLMPHNSSILNSTVLSQNQTLNLPPQIDEMIRLYRIQVACSLTLLVGVIQMLMGLTGLGFVTRYFSDSFNSAYTCGCAIHVLVSQIKDIFGFKNLIKYGGFLNIPKVGILKKYFDLQTQKLIIQFRNQANNSVVR
jgi:MFS superfamily sulfate permease-like transporter